MITTTYLMAQCTNFLLLLLSTLASPLPPPPDLVLQDVFPSAQLSHYYHRRPALLLTSQGMTLLAFAERSMQEDAGCWQGGVSVVVKRSRDGGITWSDASIVISSLPDDAVGKNL